MKIGEPMSCRNEHYDHIFTIGTNRFLGESLESYLEEIRFMEKSLKQKVPFLIIDESELEIEQRNRALIEKLQTLYPTAILIHMDALAQKNYFNYFLESGVDQEIVDLLNFTGLSYGRLINKQFLLAATFGADYIHRRDSDTKIKANFGFPSEMELAFLGKNVSEANHLMPSIDLNYNDEKPIYLVGSGYSGGSDWKIDYSMLLPEDPHLIMQINDMLGYSQELNEKYFVEITTKSNVVQEKVKYLPKKDHSSPDCGNISFYQIHKYLPSSPIPNTIGTDYFVTFLLKNLDLPIVYHNQFVFHEFTADRKKDNFVYAANYWPRVVNYMDYYQAFGARMLSTLNGVMQTLITIEDLDTQKLFDETAETESQIIERRERISKFGELLISAQNEHLNEIGMLFKDIAFQNKIIRNSNLGFENHRKLLAEWKHLIKVAANYSVQEHMFSKLS
jgi:hypothetical protein